MPPQDRRWQGKSLPLQFEVVVPANDDGPPGGPVGWAHAGKHGDAADELPSRDPSPIVVGEVTVAAGY